METAEERQARKQAVLDDLNSGSITSDNEAKGQFGPTFIINEEKYDNEKGEAWRQENDYGGTLYDRVTDQAMDLYRNLFSQESSTLREARQYSETMGISAQYLADNPSALEEARRIHNEAIQWSFLSGQPFNAKNIDEMYPEIKRLRQADPVGASIALKNYQELHDTRSLFERVSENVSDASELFTDAFNSGVDMVKLYDAQFKAAETGDVEAARPEVDEISRRLIDYQKERPESDLGKVVYDTIQQLTIYGTQGLRALQYVPKGMAAAMATAAPLAAGLAPETLGVGSAATLAAAGVTGAVWGFRTGMFKEMQNQSMAQRYWEMANTKDNQGRTIYSRTNMILDSNLTGAFNGGVEFGLVMLGFGPIKAAFGKEVAKKILANGAAQKAIVRQGKLALARMAAAAGAKQWARGVSAELAEEGTQSVVGDVASNLEYAIHGKGPSYGVGKVLDHAIDAMVQAVPAAVGMGGIGAGVHTAGRYRSMAAIADIRTEEWREAYRRSVEAQTIQQLIESKAASKLAKEQPDVYGKVIQAQAERNDLGTMYVDGQELSRSEKGIAVLNDAVQRGIMTAEQVDNSIENGTDIEISTGTFAQLADESFDTQTLMEATTMNKGGLHRAALREREKRMNALSQELQDIAKNKADSVSEDLMAEYFTDADEETREAASDVVYRNPFDIESSYKEALKDARTAYEQAVNFDSYWKYKPEGVSIITADAEGYNNTQTGRGYRMSNNEPWYSDMYKTYGRKATREEMLDVAYQNERKEMAAFNPELLDDWEASVQAAKKKYESLKEMEPTFADMAQSDTALRRTFSKEGAKVYGDAVKLFSSGNAKVSQAARENAYIYAKMAERWTDIMHEYGDTAYTVQDYVKAHPIQVGGRGVMKQGYGQPITEAVNLDEKIPVLTVREKYAGMDWRDLRRKLPGTVEKDVVSKKNEKGEYIPYVHERTGNKIVVTKRSLDHFKASGTSSKNSREMRENTLHYEMIEAVPEILAKGIWIETHGDVHGKALAVTRIVAPVRIGNNIYAVKVTVKKFAQGFAVEGGEYTKLKAYDVSTQKEPVAGSTSANSASKEPGPLRPVPTTDSTISIREFLKSVNDNLGEPYVNADGTPNYGIYFGDNKTGGVMYIRSHTFTQMAGVQSQTAAMDQLAIAKQRYADGDIEQDIYRETGWMLSQDGKWRYEIPDNLEAIHITKSYSLLEHVYDNPKLFAAYPELKDVGVIVDSLPENVQGSFDERRNWIYLSKDSTKEQQKQTLLHEVQHIIQRMEHFASGGNPRTVKVNVQKALDAATKELQTIPHGMEYLAIIEDMQKHPDDMDAVMEAMEKADEIEESIPERDRDLVKRLAEYIQQYKNSLNHSADTVYYHLHGEQEARHTAEQAAHPEAAMPMYDNPVIIFDGNVYEQRAVEVSPETTPKTHAQLAYHGSTQLFDQFDLLHIGEGEGQQVHGWGLYFAQDESTSKDRYMARLAGEAANAAVISFEVNGDTYDLATHEFAIIRKNGNPVTSDVKFSQQVKNAQADILSYYEDTYPDLDVVKNPQEFEQELRKKLEDDRNDDLAFGEEHATDLFPKDVHITGMKMEKQGGGTLYKVDIPDTDVMLDEQQPLSEQPAKVQRAVKVAFAQHHINKNPDSMTGKQIQKALHDVVHSDKKVALALKDAGLQGYTYYGSVDGRCFVVFDDQAIQIMERNGEVLQTHKSEINRSIQELKDEITKGLKGATIVNEENNRITFKMPNGITCVVDLKNQIFLGGDAMQQAKKDHGYSPDSDVVVEGLANTYGKDAYIALSKVSRAGTGYHEAFHVARDMVLTAEEKAALDEHYHNDEEAQADAYAAWMQDRQTSRGTLFGKLWRKIYDAVKRIQAILTKVENVHNVMRKIESGVVWTRNAADSRSDRTDLSQYSVRRNNGNVYEQRAWHGSPYDFSSFDLGAVGSGEGNQAHGWGLYFAKDKDVSEAYKDMLGYQGDTVTFNGTQYHVNEEDDWVGGGKTATYGDMLGYVLDALADGGTTERAVSLLQKQLEKGRVRGIYADRVREAITALQNGTGQGSRGGRLYEVEIPENDMLLDEQKPLKEQPETVRESVQKALPGAKETLTGKDVQQLLKQKYGTDKAVAMALKDAGLKGYTYIGQQDDRCFVVFDDAAVSVINQYNQQANSVRGAFDSSTGILHLFDTADQSTFIHEAAHMWLTDMQRLAMQEGAPEQLLEDLQVLQKWGTYDPKQLKEYRDAVKVARKALEKKKSESNQQRLNIAQQRQKEFSGYAEKIEAARKSGDVMAMKDAENVWLQERFARAFERYIAEGKAPTRELQRPFYQFKQWIVSVYRSLINLGKEPPAGVKRVMDRMLATDEEIEIWAKTKELNAWKRIGFSGNLDGEEGKMIQKRSDAIKRKIKRKLLAKYMKDVKETDIQEREQELERQRIEFEKELCDANEMYAYENLYNESPEHRAGILERLGYKNDGEYKAALKAAGGTLEERSQAFVDERKQELDEMALTPSQIRHDAEELLASTNGQAALNDLEAKAMRKYLNRFVAECVKAMRELDQITGTDEEVAAKIWEILSVETVKADQERNLWNRIFKNKDKLKRDLADMKGKTSKAKNDVIIRQLKADLNAVMTSLNRARDFSRGSYRTVMQAARNQLEQEKVNQSTTWRQYEVKAASASHRADQYMSAGSFEQAMYEKFEAQKYYCLSRAAKDNQDFVNKAMGGKYEDEASGEERSGIRGIIKRIKDRQKPVRMGIHERYFIEHLAYIVSMDNRDGRMPLDKDGNELGIQWQYLYRQLDPDTLTEQSAAPNGDNIIAPWLRRLVEGNNRLDYKKDLTLAQFRDIHKAIQAIYKVGKRDYEATSLQDDKGKNIGIDAAAAQMLEELKIRENWNAEAEENQKTAAAHRREGLSDALLSLTKAEVILNDMGKTWIQYVYRPIDKAARRELDLQQKAYKEFSKIYNMYSRAEWRAIRHDKVATIGRIEKYTKEQVLAIALNWGNKEGRQRILDEMNQNISRENQKYTEADVEYIFSQMLTNKDLDFLEAVWKQVGQYWPERNQVQERLYGVGMGRVPARPFTVNGRTVTGGYYPIVYDPKLSSKTTDMEMDDIVKSQLSGQAAMAVGMGSVKKRVAVVHGQTVLKALNVWPMAVNEAVHHVCMREAVTDVYKLLSRDDVKAAIESNYGNQTYRMLKQWARDCWNTDVQKTDKVSRMLEQARRKTAFAVMAYRTSTAALNLLNIFPMMREIGIVNTWQALTSFGLGFYKGTKTYQQNRQFVMEHSPFMAERINTLDRDIQQRMTFDVSKNAGVLEESSALVRQYGPAAGAVKDAVNRYGYLFITETDLMLSMALWKWQYDESLRRQVAEEGKTDELVMRDQATFEADRAVRNVLGSSQTKDQAQVQRMNSLVAQLTPFYTYSNTVLNALIQEGYRIRGGGKKVGLFNAMLFWILLPTIFETLYRSATSGDDWETMIRKMGVRAVTNTTQGLPVVRDAVDFGMNMLLDLPTYDSNDVLAVSLFTELGKAGQSLKSEKQDMTDVGRHLSRAMNRYTGFSDTLTDGFWALARFSLMDTDRSVAILINAMIFDRRYKTAAERKKEEKKKQKKGDKK